MADQIAKYFKHHSIVASDLSKLLSKYKQLAYQLGRNNDVVFMDIRGTIPYTFSGRIYNAPILIRLHALYPYTAPSIFVIPSDTIKIVANHPIVSGNGVIRMPYLSGWLPKHNLVDAVDSLQYYFNHGSPIYSVASPNVSPPARDLNPGGPSPSSATRACASTSEPVANSLQKSQEQQLKDEVLAKNKNNRTEILRGYDYNVDKLNAHMKVMGEWAPACFQIRNEIKQQIQVGQKLKEWVDAEKKELVILSNIRDNLKKFNESFENVAELVEDFDCKLEDRNVNVQELVKVNHTCQKLLDSIVKEAVAEDVLEALHLTFKRRGISTKQYVQEMRSMCHDKFLATIARRESLET